MLFVIWFAFIRSAHMWEKSAHTSIEPLSLSHYSVKEKRVQNESVVLRWSLFKNALRKCTPEQWIIKPVTCEPHAESLRHLFQVYICHTQNGLFDKWWHKYDFFSLCRPHSQAHTASPCGRAWMCVLFHGSSSFIWPVLVTADSDNRQ